MVVSVLLFTTLILTQTRTFIFAVIIILLFKFLVIDKKFIKFIKYSFILIPIFLFSFFYFINQYTNTDSEIDLDRTSNLETNRLDIIKFYFLNENYTLKSFLIGDGFLYSKKNRTIREDGAALNAHSLFPDILLENGFFIGLIFIVLYCYLMYLVFQRNAFDYDSPNYHAFQGIILIFFISNFVTGSLHHIDFQAVIFSLISSNYVLR